MDTYANADRHPNGDIYTDQNRDSNANGNPSSQSNRDTRPG